MPRIALNSHTSTSPHFPALYPSSTASIQGCSRICRITSFYKLHLWLKCCQVSKSCSRYHEPMGTYVSFNIIKAECFSARYRFILLKWKDWLRLYKLRTLTKDCDHPYCTGDNSLFLLASMAIVWLSFNETHGWRLAFFESHAYP